MTGAWGDDMIDLDREEKQMKPNYILTPKIQSFEVHPHDLPSTMTYVKAVKAVEALGDGWRIPTREELKLMYEQRNEIGGFCTEDKGDSGYPQWYWSSTEDRDIPSGAWNVRLFVASGSSPR